MPQPVPAVSEAAAVTSIKPEATELDLLLDEAVQYVNEKTKEDEDHFKQM